MKEVTYEDWQKNPTPRMMWVWNDYEEDKKKRKIIYISKETYPVVVVILFLVIMYILIVTHLKKFQMTY